jgi:hypothetical protein
MHCIAKPPGRGHPPAAVGGAVAPRAGVRRRASAFGLGSVLRAERGLPAKPALDAREPREPPSGEAGPKAR